MNRSRHPTAASNAGDFLASFAIELELAPLASDTRLELPEDLARQAAAGVSQADVTAIRSMADEARARVEQEHPITNATAGAFTPSPDGLKALKLHTGDFAAAANAWHCVSEQYHAAALAVRNLGLAESTDIDGVQAQCRATAQRLSVQRLVMEGIGELKTKACLTANTRGEELLAPYRMMMRCFHLEGFDDKLGAIATGMQTRLEWLAAERPDDPSLDRLSRGIVNSPVRLMRCAGHCVANRRPKWWRRSGQLDFNSFGRNLRPLSQVARVREENVARPVNNVLPLQQAAGAHMASAAQAKRSGDKLGVFMAWHDVLHAHERIAQALAFAKNAWTAGVTNAAIVQNIKRETDKGFNDVVFEREGIENMALQLKLPLQSDQSVVDAKLGIDGLRRKLDSILLPIAMEC